MGRKSSAEESLSALDVGVEVQVAPAFAEVVSADTLQRVAREILHVEGVPGHVTLVITDDQGIRTLNRDYRGLDTPTDVLAFSAREDGGSFVVAPGAGEYLGDVIISYPRTIDQAQEQGHAVDQELCLLTIHGMLHLLGYDHQSERDKEAMWARQEAILAQVATEWA
jgi:probable rRNA maturation factor